jgi:hypothetical protein
MGRRSHGPTDLRAFTRRLKDHQGTLEPLLGSARSMTDPASRARAMAALLGHPAAAQAVRQEAEHAMIQALEAIEREAQVA